MLKKIIEKIKKCKVVNELCKSSWKAISFRLRKNNEKIMSIMNKIKKIKNN